MLMFDEYKSMIQSASERVYRVARRTSLDYMESFSIRMGNRVCLKREDQQPVFSYKIRGSFNMISSLSKEERKAGVITSSAGNHAQGVALACHHEQIEATIVMPKTTPDIKIAPVRRLKADIRLHGNTYDDAFAHASEIAQKEGKVFVPAYDHPMIISGQVTVGEEILNDTTPNFPDIIFVPVGGGGLAAGIALSVYFRELHPQVKIIGVEPDDAPCMYRALEEGEPVMLDKIGIFADGAAISLAGKESFRIVRELVDEILLVNVDEICAAVKDIFEDTRAVAEPAGALGVAGLKQYVEREQIKDKSLVAIFSGANVNFDRLRHIVELSELGANREAVFGVVLDEKPGSFKRFCHDLGPRQMSEFNYRYSHDTKAVIFVGVRLKRGSVEKQELLDLFKKKGYHILDLSDNEVAKMHIRYMVGGHAVQLKNERLYRFEFPERIGALLQFLTMMNEKWNISLFHYRSHGAPYARVLVGIQVDDEDYEQFQQFLQQLDVQYWKEENNLAYQLFLGDSNFLLGKQEVGKLGQPFEVEQTG